MHQRERGKNADLANIAVTAAGRTAHLIWNLAADPEHQLTIYSSPLTVKNGTESTDVSSETSKPLSWADKFLKKVMLTFRKGGMLEEIRRNILSAKANTLFVNGEFYKDNGRGLKALASLKELAKALPENKRSVLDKEIASVIIGSINYWLERNGNPDDVDNLAKALPKESATPITSPVDFISGPRIMS